MYKIVFIYFIIMTVNINDWKIEATSYWDPLIKCKMTMGADLRTVVCGSDGNDYWNMNYLRCAQTMEYGKRVNLQLRHEMPCWVWERLGIETNILCLVSKLQID